MKYIKRKVRRLTNLVCTEVSAVDRGAGEGVRVMLLKRDRPVDVDDLAAAFDVIDSRTGGVAVTFATRGAARRAAKQLNAGVAGDSVAAAKREIMENRRVVIEVAPTNEEVATMPTVTKALAQMDGRIEGIMKRGEARSRESALAKIAASSLPSDRAIWDAYRASASVPGLEVVETAEPVGKGEAYEKLEKLARKLTKRTGMSEASAFARVYQDPANYELVQADKVAHADRGIAVVKVQPEPVMSAYELDQRGRAEHIRKSRLDGRAARELAFANNVKGLRAAYPKFSDSKIRRLAMQQMLGGIDLAQVAGSLGYSGTP